MNLRAVMFLCVAALASAAYMSNARAEGEGVLPPGVRAVWDLDQAYSEKTPTRERVCINGLWRWQPAQAEQLPTGGWGYFKVPGSWPMNVNDYDRVDSQTLYFNPAWEDTKINALTMAWYEREITVPADWMGRRIAVCADYLNSQAIVFVDGRKAGTMWFPGGEVDVTKLCRPGQKQVLTLLVTAKPLAEVMEANNDSGAPKTVKASVPRPGLCGDVFLAGTPAQERIEWVLVRTSTRKWEITFDAALQQLRPDTEYRLRATIAQDQRKVEEFDGPPFRAADLKNGRLAFSARWKPKRLWDLHTPGNMYTAQITLLEGKRKVLDQSVPERFGFREFYIDGRDFYLNGSRIFLCIQPIDNPLMGAGQANYAAARETLERMQSYGINCVYTHNYSCTPGSHVSFAEVLRAADDVGMLVALSQPHLSQYSWVPPNSEEAAYTRHAQFYVRAAGNHPAVVFYATSHNRLAAGGDMNPENMDAVKDFWPEALKRFPEMPPAKDWGMRAEAIIRELDPGRIVYHHAGGNAGAVYTSNFYPNMAPAQELADWFEHWAAEGLKPCVLVEFGAPVTWDWSMYRGWYKGERAFGEANAPWETCMAEWNAQYFGDRAYALSDQAKAALRWEAKRFAAGQWWHRWDHPVMPNGAYDDMLELFAKYTTDIWRGARTCGLSGLNPWQCRYFWKLRDGAVTSRKIPNVDWDNLQRPGFSPDYLVTPRVRCLDVAFARTDYVATPAAQALIENNGPLLAYIGGPETHVTAKNRNYYEGETVEKQLIIINNSRQTVSCECHWGFEALSGQKKITVPTGQQVRIPLRLKLSGKAGLYKLWADVCFDNNAGLYKLGANVYFNNGLRARDSMQLVALPPIKLAPLPRLAIFDPKGETAKLIESLGVTAQLVDAGADLTPFDTLIIGKEALTCAGAAPNISRVRDGLKVVVFEQSAEVLEQRFGFRVAAYGLRQAFPRVRHDHALLAGLDADNLCDWRGEATLLPPRLKFSDRPRYGPTIKWCGLDVTNIYRCGCWGNVASVLIEKPARGGFLPIIDGGYSLQYSPLMEYREGQGLVLFCQMDVSGRTEREPAAEVLTGNILRYAAAWKPAPLRQALYAGEPAGKAYFETTGLSVGDYDGGALRPDQVLIVGPGGGQKLAAHAAPIAAWLKAGGKLLAVGLDQEEANAFLPLKISTAKEEHITTVFEPFTAASPFAGVGPADVHNRDPRGLPLVKGGVETFGDGVLACSASPCVVFCQMAPWQFQYKPEQYNVKKTFRRSAFLVARLLANLGVASHTPLLQHFAAPVAGGEQRWLSGFYLDQPEEWDYPYRFFRW